MGRRRGYGVDRPWGEARKGTREFVHGPGGHAVTVPRRGTLARESRAKQPTEASFARSLVLMRGICGSGCVLGRLRRGGAVTCLT